MSPLSHHPGEGEMTIVESGIYVLPICASNVNWYTSSMCRVLTYSPFFTGITVENLQLEVGKFICREIWKKVTLHWSVGGYIVLLVIFINP